MAKKWRDLIAPIMADPVQRTLIEQEKRALDDVYALAAMREERGLSQRQVAHALDVSQPSVLRIEHERDVYLSTLASYVEAMGGHLEVRAIFPDQTIDLLLQEDREPAPAEG